VDDCAGAEGFGRGTSATRQSATDDLHNPQPCRDFDVQASPTLVDTIRPASVPQVAREPTCPRRRFIDHRISDLHNLSWRSGGAADWPTTVVLGGERYATPCDSASVLELLVHRWDFAVATKRPIDVADGHAASSLVWRGKL